MGCAESRGTVALKPGEMPNVREESDELFTGEHFKLDGVKDPETEAKGMQVYKLFGELEGIDMTDESPEGCVKSMRAFMNHQDYWQIGEEGFKLK